MKYNILQEKSYSFSLSIIKYFQQIKGSIIDITIARQLLKSGTSIGANIEEALGAYSEKEFLAKLTISYKEARETKYWLRLMKDGYNVQTDSLLDDCEELLKIIGTIQIKTKNKLSSIS
ncbi:MAG: four helix bundle protein [Candidatus Marinimicrobia bacterium]|nr:four helix bundle protein [Candidatus Neomarinimicrobiota bacterium]